MASPLDLLTNSLRKVSTSRDFKNWVRHELRNVLPHASFLATIGNLYGIGSVPTHRLDVDFPLNMVEELKNSAGALDDPSIYAWFRTERLKFIDVENLREHCSQQRWRRVLLSYGMRNIITHGVLYHSSRRFVVFQIFNPYIDTKSDAAVAIIASLIQPMANAALSTVEERGIGVPRHLIGHPTISLTPTELHIVELLAQGLSNKEIARLRGVSDSTVKTQVQRTGAKLGATRRAEIVAIAMPMLSPLPAQTLVDYGDL